MRESGTGNNNLDVEITQLANVTPVSGFVPGGIKSLSELSQPGRLQLTAGNSTAYSFFRGVVHFWRKLSALELVRLSGVDRAGEAAAVAAPGGGLVAESIPPTNGRRRRSSSGAATGRRRSRSHHH